MNSDEVETNPSHLHDRDLWLFAKMRIALVCAGLRPHIKVVALRLSQPLDLELADPMMDASLCTADVAGFRDVTVRTRLAPWMFCRCCTDRAATPSCRMGTVLPVLVPLVSTYANLDLRAGFELFQRDGWGTEVLVKGPEASREVKMMKMFSKVSVTPISDPKAGFIYIYIYMQTN